MAQEFDLIVIGSGPGGLRAAIQAAKLGKKVALIEKDRAGGASIHTGTIPSKSLREAALAPASDFKRAVKRVQQIIATETKVITAQLKRNKVELISGRAAFTGPHEITVGKQKFTASHIVLATGTRPIRHPEFPFHLKNLHDSDSIFSLKKLPASLLIVGAGVIGCEYASIFARLGAKVTLVDRRKELLRSVDAEVITALQNEFKKQGVTLLLGADLGAVKKASGSTKLEVKINGKLRRYEQGLVCMGRGPNTENMGLELAGIKLSERGYIEVNPASFQSSAAHVYAVGDVIGPPALAAASAEQGRIASCRIFRVPCPDFPTAFPYGIYTIPEISSVGLSPEEAKAKNIPHVVGRAPFSELARGIIVGDENGFVKLVVHAETRELLGVHAIGIAATELVHIGQAVLALKAPVDFLVDNIFNYPTFAEAYKVAALHARAQLKNG